MPEVTLRDELGNPLLRTQQPVTIWTDDLTVEVDQARYRGYLNIFVNYTGRLTIVNILHMEEYLKGVVPGEIGPASHSNFEALKAQAVAARTYAYKNLKQFDAEGYDLCPTPRCQVYSGIKIEHPLTSQAVEETKGELMTYGGEPINALYTSTCGGHTENAEIMFEGWDYPYLKGVECYPEEETSYAKPTTIRGESLEWPAAWVHLKTGKSPNMNQIGDLTIVEAETTTAALLRYLGKSPCEAQPLNSTSWIDIGDYLVAQLCWKNRKDSLLDEKDYRYFLSRLSFSIEDSLTTHSFLFLLHDGIMTPDDLYRFNPRLSMTKSEFFESVYGVLDHYHQINTKEGQIREISNNGIQLVDDQGVHLYSYSDAIYLFQKIGEERNPRSEIGCSTGDNIEYALENDRIALLACEFDRRGAAMDRSSTYTFWRQSYTPQELGDKVSRYIDVGDVLDLQPLSYGASRRIHELKITGTESAGVLRGIRIRWALGLRDNLFTIDRVFGANG
ncbi:MAG TPA: SpoIID/LytB domain-containing protein, partial [Acidobacteriota bacterium]|nr:SpoIID/LytB domain-containing protein [Acidobacteriota bacterium]